MSQKKMRLIRQFTKGSNQKTVNTVKDTYKRADKHERVKLTTIYEEILNAEENDQTNRKTTGLRKSQT